MGQPHLSRVELGAVGFEVQIEVAYIGDMKAYHLAVLGHHLTAFQLSYLHPVIITLATGSARSWSPCGCGRRGRPAGAGTGSPTVHGAV